MDTDARRRGLLLIVSGPAGSGKTTLCDRMLAEEPGLRRVVTATTRAPREGERDGVDYHFLDRSAFEALVGTGEFYEHARVHGRLYGTLKSEVRGKLECGHDLLLNIDVQGAESFREVAGDDPLLAGRIVTVFLLPPSMEELERRLRGRGTDEEAEVRRRLRVAAAEMEHSGRYDHRIRSGTPDEDCERLRAIYRAAKDRSRA